MIHYNILTTKMNTIFKRWCCASKEKDVIVVTLPQVKPPTVIPPVSLDSIVVKTPIVVEETKQEEPIVVEEEK